MLDLNPPIIYQITNGTTTAQTASSDPQFSNILASVRTAIDAGVNLFQIREKALSARVLYELTASAVEIARGSNLRLLVNDRFDIARAAGADGVHLTSQSMPASFVREACGPKFLIGVSTHSRDEVVAARDAEANFVVFGPVFDTESKQAFGEPQGLEKLRDACRAVEPFPVIAIGGINFESLGSCLDAGAQGIAGIRMFNRGFTRMDANLKL